MMKRMLCLGILLLMPALASAEYGSIADIREQARELGRWQKTYEAHGRTIEVDIPVIVPEAESVPIVEVVPWTGREIVDEKGLQPSADQTNAGILCFYDDPAVISRINPENEGVATVSAIKPGESPVHDAFFQVFHQEPLVRRMGEWTYSSESFYPYEISAEDVFAEDNPFSLADAEDALAKILAYYYPADDTAFVVEHAEIRGRAKSKKGDNKADYPSGTYNLNFRQVMEGMPVYLSIESKRLLASQTKTSQERALQCQRVDVRYNYLEIMDGTSFFCNGTWLKKTGVREKDVPLASLDEVIGAVEREIEAGRVRSVYALRLGYCCYADPDSAEGYELYPVWLLECSRSESAKQEIMATEWETDDFREMIGFQCVVINAQTCEIAPEWIDTDEGLVTPKVVTWEEAR